MNCSPGGTREAHTDRGCGRDTGVWGASRGAGERARTARSPQGAVRKTAPTHIGESERRRPTRRLPPQGCRLRLPRLVKPVIGLDLEPDVGVEAEHLLELERRSRLDRRLARDDLADQLGRAPAPARERGEGKPPRFQVLFEDPPRRNRIVRLVWVGRHPSLLHRQPAPKAADGGPDERRWWCGR